MTKNKLSAVALLVLMIPCISRGQVLFQDAVELRKLNPVFNIDSGYLEFSVEFHREAAEILKNYTDKSTYGDIEAAFTKNPFFRLPHIGAQSTDKIGGVSSFVSNIGGLDVTNFADGLARFMVKRAKEELSIVFFDQFNEELEKQKDLQKIFPSTYSILKTASSEIYNYQKFLPALREAFEFDLDEFLTNTYDWSVSGSEELTLLNELKKKVKLHNAIKLIFYTGRELDHGKHPGDILSEVSNQSEIDFDTLDVNLRSYFRVADLFSQSLRSNTDDRYWISKHEVEQFKDITFLRIYLGLLYQKCPDDLTFNIDGGSKKFSQILADFAKDLNEVQSFSKQFAGIAAQLDDGINKIASKGSEIKGSDYVSISKNLLSMVQLVMTTPCIRTIKPNHAVLEQLEFYADHASFLIANIQLRAYSAAVFEAYAILDKALENYADRTKVLQPLLKYGSFIASVATAETSEEVSEAIEAVALPAGSARIKREVAWNVSLNGYLGFFYGKENIPLSDGTDNTAKALGVFAPVGIAASHSFRLGKSNFSATLFGSLIDIGALAAYRLNDENLEVVPDIKLEHIVSPGGYFILGLPKLPISIGYGYQIGPRLREVKADSNVLVENQYDRWSAFIVVDIPLLNFYSKPRK